MRILKAFFFTLFAVMFLHSADIPSYAQNLTWRDILNRDAPKPDHRIAYGSSEFQFGELWLPEGSGPHPVVVLIHGGCWLASLPGVELVAFMADELRKNGVAVWNIEYRRVGHEGGGFPGTFLDVASAADHLKEIAPTYNLHLEKVVSVGHSAGGHLALWLAARHKLPQSSQIFTEKPLRLIGVVSLGGIGDLENFARYGAVVCGEGTIEQLVGIENRGRDEAFRDTSPAELLPIGVTQVMIHGVFDAAVPPFVGLQYQTKARSKGEHVKLWIVSDAGHFEVIAPWTKAWQEVAETIFALLK